MAEPRVFRMPSLGADMTEGTILEWLVEPGAVVHRGDLVAVVKTDKADVEVEVFDNGTIGELLVPVGATVEIGTPLATIVAPGAAPVPVPARAPSAPPPTASVSEASVPAAPAPATPAPQPVPAPAPSRISASTSSGRVASTPYARRRAAELGIVLAQVTPVRLGQPITAADVEHQLAAKATAPVDQATAMRRAIGNLMARSKRDIPHYYLEDDVELTHAMHWLAPRNEALPVDARVLPAALFCKAVALAARHAPALNGFWSDDAFQESARVHLGVAIALRGGGLVAPAIHDADQLPLTDLMAALRDLTARARGGRLRSSEMTDATLTVTILGDQGVRAVYGVIYPPQVALVGFGKVVERAWDANGGIGLRPIVTTTLSADHRATDGHLGARFLADIGRRLHHPEELA